jgi:SNF2-related domain
MRQQSELRPYQQDVIDFLFEHDEALCVIRPGGGKTAAALTAIGELLEHQVIRHALVIAPKRVAHNVWPDEIELWSHTRGLKYVLVEGNPTHRAGLLTARTPRDITIVGIDNTQWLMEQLDAFRPDHPIFDLLVIDEISRMRNPTGKRAKEVAKRASKWRMIWGLTGTLRPNGVEDMFMPARIVKRGKLWGKSFYGWRQEHMYPTDFMGYRWAAKPAHEDQLNAEIAPHIITLRDGDMPQIPPLNILLDYVNLPPQARMQYDTMERKLFASGYECLITAASAGVASGKLGQAANGFMYDNRKQVVALHDEKREWLQDTIEAATGPLLIVYEFLEDLKMIFDVAGQIPFLGAGVSDATSRVFIEQWNKGQLPVMALHPASGGHGLNLQPGGSDMAWISPCWSPEYWEQTIARLHRSGQASPVMVRVCVARETVDELKLSRVYGKMEAQNAFEQYLRQRQVALNR